MLVTILSPYVSGAVFLRQPPQRVSRRNVTADRRYHAQRPPGLPHPLNPEHPCPQPPENRRPRQIPRQVRVRERNQHRPPRRHQVRHLPRALHNDPLRSHPRPPRTQPPPRTATHHRRTADQPPPHKPPAPPHPAPSSPR